MNNVSFGKAVKVIGSYNAALNIANIANSTRQQDAKTDKIVKSIFNDVKKGDARVYEQDENVFYILSGNEGKEYWTSYSIAFDEMDYAMEYYKGDEIADIQTESAFERHRERVDKMISKSNVQTIKVDYDARTEKINTIDILG